MEQRNNDTIFAPASVAGTGALCIVRVNGPDTFRILDSLIRFASGNASLCSGGRVKFGTLMDGGTVLDEVLVSIFRAPHSYTGEDAAEISCHSSSYIISRLLALLSDAGARMAQPGEFTMRAYLAGKMDLAQAEAVADVIASEGAAAHRIAMNQLRGGYSKGLRELRDSMLHLCALVELELDFSEEDVEFADRSQLRNLVGDAHRRCNALADSFRSGNALKNGVPVAIVGAPNTGKSTLLNALLGDDRAIVSDIPGTTRDTVEESCIIEGIKFRFIDTAGIRETSEAIEKMGIERSLREMSKADIVIFLTDALSAVQVGSMKVGSDAGMADTPVAVPAAGESGMVPKAGDGQTILKVCNKCDLLEADDGSTGATVANAETETPAAVEGWISISALHGTGLSHLRETLVRAASAGLTDTDCIVTSERHATALRNAAVSLSSVLTALDDGTPTDLLAEHLRDSIASLNLILGEEITVESVLSEVFGHFCIGK